MEAAERLSIYSPGGPSARAPPRVQRGAPDHHGLRALAKRGRDSSGLGSLGRRPGVQRGLQRGHVQQPVGGLSPWTCTTPHTRQAPHTYASVIRDALACVLTGRVSPSPLERAAGFL